MIRLSSLAFALVMITACGSGDDGGIDPVDEVTYFQDVKPIMDAKCVRCHQEGGIGPFGLDDYAGAAQHAGVSQVAINDGIMPPWKAVDGCNDYQADYSLTDAEKATINAWVDGGALEGDPTAEGQPIEMEDVSMTRVDLELEMPVAYAATKTPDDYRCFVIEWPEEYTTTRYVTGFNVVPGNDKVVHHVIAFLAEPGTRQTYVDLDAAEEGPGYTCFGGTGGPAQTWIGSWTPGTRGYDFPAGTGTPIEPGSTVILQVHYNVTYNDAEPDLTSVQLTIDDEVSKDGRVQPWANPFWLQGGMPIPANDDDVMHSWEFDPTGFLTSGQAFDIHSVGFHMHQLGKSGRLSLQRADGSEECLIAIDDWDFNWQGGYFLREKVRVNPGDKIAIECHWDNSLENQPMVNGSPQLPRDINWGEGTGDEMCLSGFYWSLAD